MKCPKCGEKVDVIDSRPPFMGGGNDGTMVRRRRSCKNCLHRFTTYEVTEQVIKTLLADQGRLVVLQDAMNGRGALIQRQRMSIPKALRLSEGFT